jgi:hypothetical protein
MIGSAEAAATWYGTCFISYMGTRKQEALPSDPQGLAWRRPVQKELIGLFDELAAFNERIAELTKQGHLVKYFKAPSRKGTSPVRTLIDATFPVLDSKEKSRWTRALEFAALTKVTAENLPRLFKSHSGIAGCARLAAKQKPRKNIYRDDWV